MAALQLLIFAHRVVANATLLMLVVQLVKGMTLFKPGIKTSYTFHEAGTTAIDG